MDKLKNNKWHNQDYTDILLKANYIEWKYFNFCSSECFGFFVYLMFDLLNIGGGGGGRVSARIFTPYGIFGESDKFAISEISPSSKNTSIKIGKNFIEAGEKKYKISGETKTVKWDLLYSQASPAIEGFSNLEIDPMGIEKANWFIAMPKAKVKGDIKIKEEKINIDAFGYADSNWGAMFPLSTCFNWAQFNDEKISLVMGEAQNFEIKNIKVGRWARIFVNYKDEKITFRENELKVEHLKWSFVPETKIKYPSLTLIKAENNDYKILLTLKTQYIDPIYHEMPFFIPIKPVVIEQVAYFQGELIKKNNGKDIVFHSINGNGFKEYTFREISFKKSLKNSIEI